MYAALRIRNAESTAHIPPVRLYTYSNLMFISPQLAMVLSCVAPGMIHVGNRYGSVGTKAKHGRDEVVVLPPIVIIFLGLRRSQLLYWCF